MNVRGTLCSLMADDLSRPREATVKRLFAVSGNRCAFPKCTTLMIDPSGSVVGEICHIKGRRRDAKRYDATQTPEQRHGFDNLILLCGPHHKVIDDDEDSYTVARLVQMKADHERSTTSVAEPTDEAVQSLLVRLDVTNVAHQHAAGAILQAGNSINVSGGVNVHNVHAATSYRAPAEIAKQAVADARRTAQSSTVEIGSFLVRWETGAQRMVRPSGPVQFGTIGETSFELRVPTGQGIYGLTVPYGLVQEAWIDVQGQVNLLFTARLVLTTSGLGFERS